MVNTGMRFIGLINIGGEYKAIWMSDSHDDGLLVESGSSSFYKLNETFANMSFNEKMRTTDFVFVNIKEIGIDRVTHSFPVSWILLTGTLGILVWLTVLSGVIALFG